MKRENRPTAAVHTSRIRLALDAVDIREESRHQGGSDQHASDMKLLMHQENIRFSARIACGIVTSREGGRILALWSVPQLYHRTEDSHAATQKVAPITQKQKYL